MPALETWTVATRRSRLALAQTQLVVDALATAHPHVRIEVLPLSTRGDRVLDKPLADVGGKALFLRDLEAVLLDGRADFAVHSAKDVPAVLPEGLELAAFPKREDPRDIFITECGSPFRGLPPGARVGTSSPRRAAQLLRLRSDLQVPSIRGNVETRLAKLAAGDFDAIILAVAGLKRLGIENVKGEILSPPDFLPAAGQGALAIEVADPAKWTPRLAVLNDSATELAVRAEREVVRRLAADCHSPVAVYGEVVGDTLTLTARVLSPDGRRIAEAKQTAPAADWRNLAATLSASLRTRGAANLLARAGRE